jgi:hypothetical protein
MLTGRGTTYPAALATFEEGLHVRFQRLQGTRPIQRNEEESIWWALLCRYIDVPRYRITTPLVTRRVGRVKQSGEGTPWVVEWEEDMKEQSVSLEKTPPEFASLHLGARFEALVAEDAKSGEYLEMRYCQRLPERETTPELFGRYWSGSSNSVPPASWSGHPVDSRGEDKDV